MSSERVTVEAFWCSCCRRVHLSETDADQCCTCGQCSAKAATGTRPPRFGYECAKCKRSTALKRVRDAIRRVEDAAETERKRYVDRMEHFQRQLEGLRAEQELLRAEPPPRKAVA